MKADDQRYSTVQAQEGRADAERRLAAAETRAAEAAAEASAAKAAADRLEAEGRRPAVIFVTAYDQHALRAFEAHAVDYLLKPFSRERFDAALAKARTLVATAAPAPRAADLAAAAREGRPLERIVVKDGPKITVIPLDRLDWVQAQDDYVLLRTEGRNLLKQQTLASLEAQLDQSMKDKTRLEHEVGL